MRSVHFLRTALLATTIALAASAGATDSAIKTYLVTLTVRDGTTIIAKPSLTVTAGVAATFMAGDERTNFRVRIAPTADAQHHGNVVLATEIDLTNPGNSRAKTAIVSLPQSTPATFRFDPIKGVDERTLDFEISARTI